MLEQFSGRRAGDHAYLECTLATDMSTDYEGETIPPHKQVDVRLPNNKLLRLPYAWLREEGAEEAPSAVLDSMLDVSEGIDPGMAEALLVNGPEKKVTVRRAVPKS
jgi:hypothetical protein